MDIENANGANKLIWTPAMEKIALEIYVKAVEAGKRGKAGFKPKVHCWVSLELIKEFPGVEFTDKKVKSKLNQVCFSYLNCTNLIDELTTFFALYIQETV
jgi:hypothetical protein